MCPIPEPAPKGVKPRTKLGEESGPSKLHFPKANWENQRIKAKKKGECYINKGTIDVYCNKKRQKDTVQNKWPE